MFYVSSNKLSSMRLKFVCLFLALFSFVFWRTRHICLTYVPGFMEIPLCYPHDHSCHVTQCRMDIPNVYSSQHPEGRGFTTGVTWVRALQ